MEEKEEKVEWRTLNEMTEEKLRSRVVEVNN